MTRPHTLSVLALVVITVVWGATFVMVKGALDSVGPLTFVGWRFILATGVLAALFARRLGGFTGEEVRAGLLTGVALAGGYAFQTIGLQTTTSSKAGFITGLSVVIVPVLAATLLRQPPRRAAVFGIGVATVGLALLSLDESLQIQTGDLWVLACAVAFAFQITGNAHFVTAANPDPIRMAVVQLGTVAVLCTGGAFLVEQPALDLPAPTWGAIAFTGVAATAAVYSVQLVAQKHVPPSQTALIFALEPVFAALFGFLLAAEVLAADQVVGCGLILLGMLAAEYRAPR